MIKVIGKLNGKGIWFTGTIESFNQIFHAPDNALINFPFATPVPGVPTCWRKSDFIITEIEAYHEQ